MCRRTQLIALLLLLWSTPAFAQVESAPGIQLQDEGVNQGRIQILNCSGAGVSCAKSGVTGTATISGGGGGSANTVAVTVDFGASGSDTTQTVVTGQAWVSGTSVIVCGLTAVATASRTEGSEEGVWEGLVSAVHSRVAGTGFTLLANPRFGRAIGSYVFHCTGA